MGRVSRAPSVLGELCIPKDNYDRDLNFRCGLSNFRCGLSNFRCGFSSIISNHVPIVIYKDKVSLCYISIHSYISVVGYHLQSCLLV